MIKRFSVLAVVSMVSVVLFAGVAIAQEYPMMNMIANNVIQKYQQSTCEQLWQKKSEPKPAMEQEFIQMLRGDPTMRQMFINKIAAPVANKMFECGMIP